MKRKLMRILLAALLAVGLAGVSAPAARADDTVYTEGTLYYTITNESITITGCFGWDAEVHVPAMIAGIPVNTIAAGAFAENENVKTVYLPDTITTVEPGAFGSWVKVIYNANTDHPQDTPTDLILGLLPQPDGEPSPTEPPAEPEPTEPPAEPTPAIPEGSATVGDIEEQATPTPTSAPAQATQAPAAATATPEPTPDISTETGEADLDPDAKQATAAPTEAPKATEAPQATDAPTEAPKATDAPVKAEPTAEPAPEPEATKSMTVVWVFVGVVLAGGIAALVAARRKRKA